MSKRLIISFLELAKLQEERYHYPCPIVQKRLNALVLKATTTYSNKEVAKIVGCHYNLVANWMKLYEELGFAGIATIKYGTNKSDLEHYAINIIAHFTKHPPRSLAEAVIEIEKLTSIKRSESRVRVFLKKHGFSFLKRVIYLPRLIQLLKKIG